MSAHVLLNLLSTVNLKKIRDGFILKVSQK